MFSKNRRDEKISFSWGYPDLEGFPLIKFKKIINNIAPDDVTKIFQYHPGQGVPNLRNEIVKQKMGDFGEIVSDEIVITPGATFGIFLLAYYFKNVLGYKEIGVFFPCYDTALQIFKIIGLEAIDLDNKKSIATDLKCLYLTPRYSNPSGDVLSDERVRMAEKYIRNGALIIEDDVYHTFNYSDESFATFKQKFPKNVFYLDSFSKILAPGFRLGYIAAAADKKSVRKLVHLQMFMCSSASTLNQEIVYQLLKGKNYKKVIEATRNFYRLKMELTLDALKGENLDNKFLAPIGGFYIWLKTDYYFSGARKKLLNKQGVNLIDGRIYYPNKKGLPFVRLSIANIAKNEIKESVKLIKKYLYEG